MGRSPTQRDSLVSLLQCLFGCHHWLRIIALQGRSTLPRRSSSFTNARSPDSRTAMPDAFSTDPYSATPKSRAAPTSSSSKGTPVSTGSAARGSFGQQHGSSSSLETTAGVQGSPSASASPLSKAQRTPPISSRYSIVQFSMAACKLTTSAASACYKCRSSAEQIVMPSASALSYLLS